MRRDSGHEDRSGRESGREREHEHVRVREDGRLDTGVHQQRVS